MKTLTLKHIQYLSVLYESNSFKEASKKLNVTQAAFIHTVRRLESYLGIQLIISKNKADSIQVNPEHKWVIQNLINVHESLEVFKEDVSEKKLNSSAYLNLESSLFEAFIAPSYQEFTQNHPNIVLHIQEEPDFFPLKNDLLTFNTILFTDTVDPKDKHNVYTPFHSFNLSLLTTEKNLLEKGRIDTQRSLVQHTLLMNTLLLEKNLFKKEILTAEKWQKIISVNNISKTITLLKNLNSVALLPEEIVKLLKFPFLKVLPDEKFGHYTIYLKMNKYFAKSDVGSTVKEWILNSRNNALKSIGIS